MSVRNAFLVVGVMAAICCLPSCQNEQPVPGIKTALEQCKTIDDGTFVTIGILLGTVHERISTAQKAAEEWIARHPDRKVLGSSTCYITTEGFLITLRTERVPIKQAP